MPDGTSTGRSDKGRRALTGLAAGALAGAVLLAVLALGTRVGLPDLAAIVFDWLVRVLPGGLVVWGLESTLRLLEALGFDIGRTTALVEAALAQLGVFIPAVVAGLLFFVLVDPRLAARAPAFGRIVGGLAGVAFAFFVLAESAVPTPGVVAGAVGIVAVYFAWGWGLGRLFLAAYPVAGLPLAEPIAPAAASEPPAPATPASHATQAPSPAAPSEPRPTAERLDRRHFIIRIGGLTATFVVLGAEVARILRAESAPSAPQIVTAPLPFPNADSPVKPVPGTRPEYTAVADHFVVDIDLRPPAIDAASWRLRISGLVARPIELTYEQLLNDYETREEFVTLSCVSNPVGGPLLGTTLWSGPSLRDVLAAAQPAPAAQYVHMLSDDDYDEVVDLAVVRSDPRILLAHSWNGEPLTAVHGFPLRVAIPDVYGMKQPKWLTELVLVPNFIPGYWVGRGWDTRAQVRTTSMIDTVDTADLITRDGQTYVPIGGVAVAGARGISKVEVQTDGGSWEAAELRQPLSALTWVIWRYEWPWQEGRHVFAVRAYDGQGHLQEMAPAPPRPAGATGVDTETATVLPG